MRVVQVKGANGSGKTTLALQMLALSDDVTYLSWDDGTVYATVLNDIGWILIGKYVPGKRMGGCDLFKTVAQTKQAILDVLDDYHGDDGILFEGMMISTIKSTFYDWLLQLEKERYIQPAFLILASNAEECVERIRQRGSMKDGLNIDNIRTKCTNIIRHAKTYDERYVHWLYPDEVERDGMLDEMLYLLDMHIVKAAY